MKAVSIRMVPRKSYVSLSFAAREGEKSEIPDFATLISNPKHVIINCAGLSELPTDAEDAVGFLYQQLKEQDRKVSLVFAGEKMRHWIAGSARCSPIPQYHDLLGAIHEFESHGGQGASSAQFIKAFVNSTLRTIYVQCRTRCQRGKVHVKTEETNLLLGDISGIVLAVGYAFSYAVVLSFPKATFLKLLGRMLDQELTAIDEANRDGATELMNMIYGHAKRVLNEKGAGLEPQIPVLNLGRAHDGFAFPAEETVSRLEDGKTLVIPFEAAEVGQFFIEIWFPAAFTPEWLT